MTDFLAKVANKRELTAVLSWLRREHEWTSLVSDGSFWHNRSIIADAHDKKRLYVLAAGHRIAGFLVGSLTGDLSMLEVRPELRRYGLGQQLVEHYLDCTQKAGGLGARVECHPPSSAPFWKQLGFRPYFDRRPLTTEEGGSFTRTAQRLARILSGKSEVPEDAPHVPVTIAFVEPANLVPIAPPFTTEAARVGAEWCFVKSFCEYFQSVDS